MLAEIDRPVLVIEAAADQFIELRHFEIMTKTIPGARRATVSPAREGKCGPC
jgi:hypothetical protein